MALRKCLRVLIVVEVRIYRESLSAVLSRTKEINVVSAAGNATQALACAREFAPDLILLDPAIPGIHRAVAKLSSSLPSAKVIALAVSESTSEVVAGAEVGLAGFVGRDRSITELLDTIHTVAAGRLVCSPSTAGALLRRVASLADGRRSDESPAAHLTTREHQVANLIEQGLSNKQIATRLFIELPTVKHHVHHILAKLGVSRRAEAAARLRRRELNRR